MSCDAALRAVARHRPLTHWRMTYGAALWWEPDELKLTPEGFATRPFGYAELASVTVYREAAAGREVWRCDWPALKAELARVAGLSIKTAAGVRPWPASPPTDALELSLGELL